MYVIFKTQSSQEDFQEEHLVGFSTKNCSC